MLQTLPGITFGAGEGGGGYGDSINLRGYSASNDITIDGVRDSAQYSRTDPFNLQQVEVYNGANSVFNGSGSVGGTINLVSKVPGPETLTIMQGSVGTDNYYRGAIDSNVRLSDLVAVRLNGAYHHNDVPGRDVEKMQRWGIAPSVTIGIGGPTSLTLAYVHQGIATRRSMAFLGSTMAWLTVSCRVPSAPAISGSPISTGRTARWTASPRPSAIRSTSIGACAT